jgi:hypothetical protein
MQTSTQRRPILTEAFRGFSQSLQANAGKAHQISRELFLPYPFQFILPLIYAEYLEH